MKRTISIAIGKGSIGHNNRIFYAPNVDRKRTSDNITLVSENIKEVYHELFDKALEKYNAKQKRKDRVIKDYYEHINHSKQENEHLSVLDFKKRERQCEIAKLEDEIESANKTLEDEREVIEYSQNVANELGVKYHEIKAEYQKTEEMLSEKNAELEETSAAIESNQKLLAESADKVSKIQNIDSIETGKTVFGGKVTVSKEDYTAVSELAKKQIAYESKENALSSEIEQLKSDNNYLRQEKSVLISENNNLKNEVKSARSLKASLSNALSEIENWKRRYNKVMEFIERLDLTKKLQEFLKPVIKHRSR